MRRVSDEEETEIGGIAAAAGVSAVEEVSEVEVMPAADPSVAAGPQVSGTAAGVRRWVEAAAQFSRAQTAAMVMAGFELAEVKRRHGFVQGGRYGGAEPTSHATWAEFVRAEIGISDDTARNWMRMAEAVKPRLKRLGGLRALMEDILSKPLSALSSEQTLLLTEAVDKVADGKSQMEFMWELGIAKRPQGVAAKGGATGGGSAPRSLGGPDGQRLIAREDWATIVSKLEVARENFTLIEDAELERVLSLLDAYAGQIRFWTRCPKSARTPEMVRSIAEALR